MLKPKTNKYPQMTAEQRQKFEQALAEEQTAKAANIAAAKEVLPRLIADCQQAVDIVRQLREAREAAGVSLAELEQRTGIRKSVRSRLENSKAPNPTLATLQRYCEALGMRFVFSFEDGKTREPCSKVRSSLDGHRLPHSIAGLNEACRSSGCQHFGCARGKSIRPA